ncbi:MAG: adenylate cyclase [Clostridia bacterium]|nr:adenylate cyclase [Clostridia bacterium]
MEIERKFLVKEIPNLTNIEHKNIIQVYVTNPKFRARKMDNKYFITQKSDGTLVREEIEWEITEQEWLSYYNKYKDVSVEKTRYFIPLDSYVAELDIYEGKNKGLLTVEVEFPSYEEAVRFTPPSWFGEDITEKLEYQNKNLAINPRNC